MTIILYDIPTKDQTAMSPNTWKTRFSLNYKGLPYKTEWVEFPDIDSQCKKLGIPSTSTNSDGSPSYTLPAIHDPKTGSYISDSLAIAEYLEKTYPDTKPLFPYGTVGIQSAFEPAFTPNISALWQFIAPSIPPRVSDRCKEHVVRTKSAHFGMPLNDLLPKGKKAVEEWKKFEAGLGVVDSWYWKGDGPFIMGNNPCWADFVVVSYVIEFPKAVFGEDSQQWKDIVSWHDGRWNDLRKNLEEYETVL